MSSIQLVIPMAGKGQRFVNAGYTLPKPLLPVHGYPMFLIVLANLLSPRVSQVVLVSQRSMGLRPVVEDLQGKLDVQIHLYEIDYTTEGAAATIELAIPLLDLDLPVVTANSDQFVDFDPERLYEELIHPEVSGVILTMEDSDPKWSFVELDEAGYARQVVEKEPISQLATVGIYGFASGHVLKQGIDLLRHSSDTVNGELYLAPAYTHLYAQGHKASIVDLGPISTCMHGMGIPEDYENFLSSAASNKAAQIATERLHQHGRV